MRFAPSGLRLLGSSLQSSLGPTGGLMATAAISNAASQGIGIITGQQERFDWRGVAAAAIAAPIAKGIGNAVSGALPTDQIVQDFVGRLTHGVVNSGISILVHRGGKIDYVNIAADAFGNAIANSVVEETIFADINRPKSARINGERGETSPIILAENSIDSNGRQQVNDVPVFELSPVEVNGGRPIPKQTRDALQYLKDNYTPEYIRQNYPGYVAEDGRRVGPTNERAQLLHNPPVRPTTTYSQYDNYATISAPRPNYVRDSIIGKIAFEGLGDLYGSTVGKLLRSDGLAVNPFTDEILSPRREQDAKLFGLVGALPQLTGALRATKPLATLAKSELQALRGAGLTDNEIAEHIELLGDLHLFRGTSSGFPGSPLIQQIGVTPTTTDPLVATIFALESRSVGGNPILLFGEKTNFGRKIEMGSVRNVLEREVQVGISPTQFANNANYEISVDLARQTLADMGIVRLPRTFSSDETTDVLRNTPRLTPIQIREFVLRVKSGSSR